MSTQDHIDLVARAYLEGMNRRDMTVIRSCFAADYVNHFPAGQGHLEGIEDFVESLEAFLGAFTGLVFTVEQAFGEGDRVALRWSAEGVHTGDYRGLPPTRVVAATGRTISFSATDIYRIAHGRIAEEWNTFDGFDVLRQMGALDTVE